MFTAATAQSFLNGIEIYIDLFLFTKDRICSDFCIKITVETRYYEQTS